MDQRSHAFTLIELLIVVAIIAILAAIAVPNFLEAQTRAKVSRVHNDMRTIAVAIESYQVDHRRPPIGCNEGRNLGLWAGHELLYGIGPYIMMTTPVAYITTIPTDPFNINASVTSGTADFDNFPLNVYYGKKDMGSWDDLIHGRGFTFAMRSIGPAKMHVSPWVYEILGYGLLDNTYDSTNGTVSKGYIIRTNKGIYPAGM